MTGRSEDYHAALASASRRQVLDALLAAPGPMDAAGVAEQLALHVTTARFHLDQLTDAGLARRRPSAEKRRGRPRILYSAAGAAHDTDAREQLIEVLADTLAREHQPSADATSAGRRWADTFDPPDTDGPVAGLVEVLDQIGFDPELTPDAKTIRLHACPFRSAAREHPEVVCSVHRGLVQRLLESTGPAPQLVPFVEPELCLVTLDRPRTR
ncbi:helix-turn-helix transcriptional regulator [Promicromonospora vindobonensis]|uniref:Helix-turn-helix transcriptional regulator n=1 Tax=Promicromonospora vindobonensis TaxID=195748 RepID=A0ABW5VM74_9MICO